MEIMWVWHLLAVSVMNFGVREILIERESWIDTESGVK
jgi:hypothetical protein